MAIPAIIQGIGERQANYGASIGQSLAKLGQQVGQQLAQREYQRQAAEALPAMQESYSRAFDKIQQNDISGGYMDVLNTSMQFGATQNPFLMGYIEQANKFAKEAGDARLSQGWQTIQQNRGMVSDMSEVPSANDLLSGKSPSDTRSTTATSIPAMQTRGVGSGMGGGTLRDKLDQEAADNLPQKEPTEEGSLIGRQEGFSFQGGNISGPSLFQPPPEYIEAGLSAADEYANKTPSEQKKIRQENTTASFSGEPILLSGIPGYEGVSVTPPTRNFVETERSAEEEYSSKGKKSQLKVKTEVVNQTDIDTFNATIDNARYAGYYIKSNPQLSKIAETVNNDWTRIKTRKYGTKDRPKFEAIIDNGRPIILDNEDDYKYLNMLTTVLPSQLLKFGSKYIQQPEAEAAPAEAAPMTAAEQVRAKYGKTKQAGTTEPAMQQGMPAVQAPAAPRYSSENPYAKQVSEVAPPSKTYQQPSRSRQPSMSNLQRKLSEVESDIKNIDKYKVGRRAATNKEKADRWEELQSEKNRLEQILAQ